MSQSEEAIPAPKPPGFQPAGFAPAVLLFIFTALVFLRATKADFLVYDDTTFVTRNVHVNTGLTKANIFHAFSGMDEVNWEPITTLSHLVDCQFFKLNPRGHHLVNVLIHALNVAGLFLLLRKLTKAAWPSLIVAALFGLHPLRVESVAWIAERKDVLCVSFWLLATWAYLRYVEEGTGKAARKYYWACLGLFAAGLMAKPMMVTFPFFLLLLDYWPLKRLEIGNFKAALMDKIPLLVLTAADCMVTYFLQKQYGAVSALIPISERLSNAIVSYARYLGKFLWPTHLAVLYPLQHWGMLLVALAAVLLIGITVAAVALRKRCPWFIVGWLWYLGTMVPVIGLVQVGEQSIADRYTYFPMIGIAIIAVWGARELTRAWDPGWWAVPLVLLFGCYSFMTWRQIGFWQESHALFEHAVNVTENNYIAETILADVFHAHEDTERSTELLKDALRVNPDFVPALELQKTWQSDQDIAMGKRFLQQGLTSQALPYFQEAERLRRRNSEVHFSLGVIYRRQNHLADAEREFRVALFLTPETASVRRFLAFTLIDDGKATEGIHELEKAAQLHPESFEAHCDLAKGLAQAGRRKDSIAELKLALIIKPGDAAAASHLADLESAESHSSPEASGPVQR